MVTLNLKRIRAQEEPQSGLIFWFDGIDSNGNGVMASVFNEPRNVTARISGDAINCFEIKFPFSYSPDNIHKEAQFKRAVERQYIRMIEHNEQQRCKR